MKHLTIRRTIILNDLHKYLIGTAAGIVLCLLIWGGYSLIFGRKGTNNIPISKNELNGDAMGTSPGRSSDILGNNGAFVPENDNNELTQEQQERLLAAQAANESLTKKYDPQDGSNVQNQQSLSNGQADGTGDAYQGVFGYDTLALNRGTQEQEAVREIGNQKLEEGRNKVRAHIVQGKNAAQKNPRIREINLLLRLRRFRLLRLFFRSLSRLRQVLHIS